jgi:hypothetical protein
MRTLAIALLTAVGLGPAAGTLEAAYPRHTDTYSLKKEHKQQRKQLKEQQRGIKQTMSRHPQSREQQHLLKHELKAQKQTLRNQQKGESRMLKGSHKSARNPVKVAKSSP